ncbi:cytochrome C [Pendulispora albinea]|uniref:Cytochrome C n=1 Tax=Pendulispora albinea TaxID=2741071 RepID=A0ABZ2M5W4_9BACT
MMSNVMNMRANIGLSAMLLLAGSSACEVMTSGPSTETARAPEGSGDRAVRAGTFVTTLDTPVGFAFEIDNGKGVPLSVRRGQTFYVSQIDLRASVEARADEGIRGLGREGDFASLDWSGRPGEGPDDESFIPAKGPGDTFVRRRFYQGARWMRAPSIFSVEQLDAHGRRTAEPIFLTIDAADCASGAGAFFTRRFRAIQWTHDCASASDCARAQRFSEEALVELRNANRPAPTSKMQPNTVALRIHWSQKREDYTIPVTQIDAPRWDYGFDMDIQALTPPGPSGFYAPGQRVTFEFTLKDGAGNPLHAPGEMPSFRDFMQGKVESGIQYWRGFQEPSALFYRRKHRESHLNFGLMGPIHRSKPIYTTLDIASRMDPATGMLTTALPSTDGMFGQATAVPSFASLFGGQPAWSKPSTDTWTFDLPPDAEPGTYYVVLKARRKYLGEEVPMSKVMEIQVGKTERTPPRLGTGGCGSCHRNGGDFKRALHGLGVEARAACTVCHAPMTEEMDAPIASRVHFIHSRADNYRASRARCEVCHLTRESIQRTSKGACLSCHRTYPADHVSKWGPITDSYTGGGPDAFVSCASGCHTRHDFY